MSRERVTITGVNTSNLKILTQEEMEELFKKKDKESREKLVNANLKLVLSILKKVNTKNENLDDLFQIGCVGLLKAIDNFDLSYNVKFSTYCVPMIEGEIKRYLRDKTELRISRSIKDLSYKIMKEKEIYLKEHEHNPSLEYLADKFKVNKIDIINALESLREPISIFEPIYNDGGDTIYLYDQIEDKKSNNDIETKLSINKAFNDLSKRERSILEKRYIIGKTQIEIAEELGISQAQISRIEKNSLKKIREKIDKK